MYKDYFGLNSYPFSMTPNPKCLFLTAQHCEAMAGLAYAILNRKGLVVLSGEVGTGKTTLLARLLGSLPPSQVRSSVVRHPTLAPNEFLEMVMLDFGMREIPASKALRLAKLQGFLMEGHRTGTISALIIDEAQKLSTELMEEVRLLGNLDTSDQKLLQIVMAGQSELDAVLRREDLRQLKQRVAVRLSLKPLGASEVEQYIRYRWVQAGGKPEHPFNEAAVSAISRWSKGIPRLINSICDNSLLAAFAGQQATVDFSHVLEAASDLDLDPAQKTAAPVPAAAEPASAQPSPASAAPKASGPVAVAAPAPAPAEKPAPVAVQESPQATIPSIRVPEFCNGDRPRPSLLNRWAAKLGLAS